MEKFLLDTHVLIWWLNGNELLGKQTRVAISESKNIVFVSAATVWEMSIKRQLGKLEAPNNLTQKVEAAGFSHLPISLVHGEVAGKLPSHHKDPFDRMLIAQAQSEGLTLVSQDLEFPKYGVRLMDASC